MQTSSKSFSSVFPSVCPSVVTRLVGADLGSWCMLLCCPAVDLVDLRGLSWGCGLTSGVWWSLRGSSCGTSTLLGGLGNPHSSSELEESDGLGLVWGFHGDFFLVGYADGDFGGDGGDGVVCGGSLMFWHWGHGDGSSDD